MYIAKLLCSELTGKILFTSGEAMQFVCAMSLPTFVALGVVINSAGDKLM